MIALGDLAGLVGEDGLEAVPVVVGEGQLRAGMRALATDQDPRARGPGLEVEPVGDLGDLPVGALAAVLIERTNPVLVRDVDDRGADGLGQVIADREPDPAVVRPVEQLVAGAGAIDAEQLSLIHI